MAVSNFLSRKQAVKPTGSFPIRIPCYLPRIATLHSQRLTANQATMSLDVLVSDVAKLADKLCRYMQQLLSGDMPENQDIGYTDYCR